MYGRLYGWGGLVELGGRIKNPAGGREKTTGDHP